jgi:hypothetical protein
MVVELICRQDIENGVVDYLRNCGESVEYYDIDAIVDIFDEYCCGYDIGDGRLDSLIMDVIEDAMLNGFIA